MNNFPGVPILPSFQRAKNAPHNHARSFRIPLYADDSQNRLRIENKFGIVRKDQWGQSGYEILGIVSQNYQPLQNHEAFGFFDPIVGKDAAIYHTAGVLGKGERIWLLAKLPENIRVIGDDITEKYLLLSNSHDGTSAVHIKFTPIRVVCQNTLTMALSQGPTLRVAHTRDLHQRLREAESLLGLVKIHYQEIERDFQSMAGVQLSKSRLADYLKAVFPDPRNPQNERALQRALVNRQSAEALFETGTGNRMPKVAGTLWAAYNGVVELIDHPRTARVPDRHLNSIWFGDGYLTKARAFQVAKDKLAVWLN